MKFQCECKKCDGKEIPEEDDKDWYSLHAARIILEEMNWEYSIILKSHLLPSDTIIRSTKNLVLIKDE